MKIITIACVGLLSLYSSHIFSESIQLSSGNSKALHNATFLLNNPAARETYIRKSSNAQQADKTLGDLAGSEQTSEEIYRLASDVFASITLKANGDPDKMMQLLLEAQQNPEAFANSFTPEQRKKLSELARQVEGNRK